MKILCPHCGVKGSADDSYCDRKVKCPKCDTIFLVQAEMALDQDSSLPDTAPVIDDAVLDSEPTEKPEPGAAQIDEDDFERVTEDEVVDDVDLAGVSAEIDQQLRESENEEVQSPEESDESLGLLDDLHGADDIEETGPVAGMAEAGGESLATEEIVSGDVEEEAEPAVVAEAAELEQETLNVSEKESSRPGPEVEQDIDSEMAQVKTPYYNFSIAEALKEAWDKTNGAKGSIWGASVIMYLATFVVITAGALIFPSGIDGMVGGIKSLSLEMVQQLVTSIVSVLFTAGLLYMGIRKVVGDPISWRMITQGFSSAGNLILATILQFFLIAIGLCLLVLPGIYLIIGYILTVPLIVEKGMSPWQAMETSRKTIHKIWWKVFGLFVFMSLICMISSIPLGIGLIWTWPMCIILVGVLYCYLFGTADTDE